MNHSGIANDGGTLPQAVPGYRGIDRLVSATGETGIERRAEATAHPARYDAQRIAAGAFVSPHGGGSAMRILLVDDHQDTIRVMRLFLERHGYVVHTAGTVREALEIASAEDVDVLVSDIGLPDGSGIELLHALNRIRSVQGIAFSGFGMPDDIKRSMDAGFHEHIVKPNGLTQLCNALERLGHGRFD